MFKQKTSLRILQIQKKESRSLQNGILQSLSISLKILFQISQYVIKHPSSHSCLLSYFISKFLFLLWSDPALWVMSSFPFFPLIYVLSMLLLFLRMTFTLFCGWQTLMHPWRSNSELTHSFSVTRMWVPGVKDWVQVLQIIRSRARKLSWI